MILKHTKTNSIVEVIDYNSTITYGYLLTEDKKRLTFKNSPKDYIKRAYLTEELINL